MTFLQPGQPLGVILCSLLVTAEAAHGNDEPPPTKLSIGAFVDTYFGWNSEQPGDGRRPSFLFNHARHQEFSVNLAILRAKLETNDLRLAVGLMAGSYVEDNLGSEPAALRHIWEAVAGMRLVDSWWLEAGIFESHIGYESAISTQNPTLSRSLAAENSPYYLAGARLSWQPAPDWTLKVLVTNGWQNIREAVGTGNKGLGTQLLYEPSSGLEFNWSTWFSDEATGPRGRPRLFNNIYAGWRDDCMQLVVNFDVGAEQGDDDDWDAWYTFYLIGRARIAPSLFVTGRIEHFEDPEGVIIAIDGAGRSISGASVGLDVVIATHGMLRLEARLLHGNRSLYVGMSQQTDFALTTSLAAEL